MPGRLFLTSDPGAVAVFLGVRDIPNDPPRANIQPGQEVLALGPEGAGRMRWGMIPVGRRNARGRPVMETLINARSETLFDKSAYAGVGRAVVPADGWYEWTGESRKKTAWAIRPRDGGLLGFAAVTDVWEAPGGLLLPQLALVTCPPSGDVRDVHHRMGVLLEEADFGTWLHGTEAEVAPLMKPWPEGRLVVEPAGDVDWSAP